MLSTKISYISCTSADNKDNPNSFQPNGVSLARKKVKKEKHVSASDSSRSKARNLGHNQETMTNSNASPSKGKSYVN